jgi:hypothetical protein
LFLLLQRHLRVMYNGSEHTERSTRMSAKTCATIEDLYKVKGKAELVNGEIIEMPLYRLTSMPGGNLSWPTWRR